MFSHIKEFFTRPSGYNISRSVRLRSSASAYFNRTPASTTNRRTWTWSAWVKRGALGAAENLITAIGSSRVTYVTFTSADKLVIYSATSAGGGDGGEYITTQVFRDPSAWYHIIVAYDSTQATSTNRIKAYVNGSEITSWSTSTAPTLNHDTQFNWTTAPMQIGAYNTTQFFDGYLTEINFIDGQALTPSSFGETDSITGVWKPKKYSGTYGTNGFYLNFSDNSNNTATTIGKDYSGNGNNWTPNNISVTSGSTYDSMTDVPTLTSATAANYCVLNPLVTATGASISNGNLTLTRTSGADTISVANMAVNAGMKVYWECTLSTLVSAVNSWFGLTKVDYANGTWSTTYSAFFGGTGAVRLYGSTLSSITMTIAVNDVLGFAYDQSAGTFSIYQNNTLKGTISSLSTTDLHVPSTNPYDNTNVFNFNFGQRPFSYTPPTGYVALNTYNLPAGSITTSGSFTGNASTDGPFVYLNGVPTTMTINGNAVTFGTNADHLANGFKVRSSSSSYNASGSNTYSVSVTGAKFKNAIAQTNP